VLAQIPNDSFEPPVTIDWPCQVHQSQSDLISNSVVPPNLDLGDKINKIYDAARPRTSTETDHKRAQTMIDSQVSAIILTPVVAADGNVFSASAPLGGNVDLMQNRLRGKTAFAGDMFGAVERSASDMQSGLGNTWIRTRPDPAPRSSIVCS